jgi:hypothetical protein
MKPKVFKNIVVAVAYKKIYRRLGYRDNLTRLSLAQRNKIEGYINEALGLLRVKGMSLRLRITKNDCERILLSQRVVFKSKSLALLLRDSREALLMAVTCGNKIMRAIKKYTGGDDMVAAVVFDAVASEVSDAGLDWLMGYYNQQLLREKKYLTSKRFSCGYGDFTLENQKLIYRLLKLKSIGIRITRDCLLIPEKSVSAVAGIKNNI